VIKWVLRRAIDLAVTAVVGGFGLARTAGRTRLGPAGRRHCLHRLSESGIRQLHDAIGKCSGIRQLQCKR
jgi:hypothetical protein